MVELKLYEVVPEMNSRGQMGRVVINPSIPKRIQARETGKIYVCCCKRIFLTAGSFENHRENDCKRTVENNNEAGCHSLQDIMRQVCSANEIKRDTCSGADLVTLKKNSSKGSGAFICQKCPYTCSDRQRFERHVKEAHSEELKQTKAIIQGDAVTDNEQKNSRVYKCNICNNYKTTYKCNLNLHKQKAHVKNGEYPCTYCTCRYGTQSGLTLHLHRVHSSKIRKVTTGRTNEEEENVPSENSAGRDLPHATSAFVADWINTVVELHNQKLTDTSELDDYNSPKAISVFKCKLCSKVFEKKFQLTRHRKQEHSIKTLEELKEFSGITANSIERNSSFSSNNENTVNKPARNKTSALKRGNKATSDIDMSTPSKRQKISESSDMHCDLCGFISKKSGDLDLHRKVAHVVFGVECECGCSFGTATELTNHKNNECLKRSVGDWQSTISTDLSLADQGLRPQKYKCECGVSFRNRRKLSQHRGSDRCKNNVKIEEKINETLPTVPQDSYSYAQAVQCQKNLTSPQPDSETHRIQCPKCDVNVKNDMGLRVHLHAMHNEDLYDKCEICQYHTRTFHAYRLHKKTCHAKDGIHCPVAECLCTLKTIDSLTRHCRNTHQMSLDRTQVEIKCEQCDFIAYKAKDLEKHLLKGHNEEVQIEVKTELVSCEQCGYTTAGQSQLEQHVKRMHVENGVECKLCNCTFNSEVGLRIHTRMMHDAAATNDFSICKLCNYKTGTRKYYKEHYKRCHVGPVKCPECVCTFMDVDGMSRHASLLHKKKIDKTLYLLKCNYPNCMFTTYYPTNLKQHEVTHSSPEKIEKMDDKLVTCNICNAKITNLRDHLSRAHVKDGFNCPENCKCSFSTELGLSRHMIQKHGKKMETKKEVRDPLLHPVKCSECEFRSKDEISLNRHLSIMHGFTIELPKMRKKRVCDICHVRTSGTLKSHKQRYHVPNGFKCLLSGCPCSFETAHSRTRHMAKAHHINQTKRCHICKLKYLGTIDNHIKRCHVENGLKCGYEGCSCSFESELGRQVHMRRRHNQKMPKEATTCQICGYFVTGKIKLDQHVARCHVPNGLPCSFCSCSFESENGRTIHVKTRHNITVSANCTLCGVKPVVSMNAHMKQSHVAGGLPCNHCECAFKTERTRSRHLARYHNIIAKPTPKRCPECKMIIHVTMNQHFKNHHVPNGVRCRYCCWSFRSEKGQIVHMLKKHKHQVLNDSSKTFKQTVPEIEILSKSIKKQMELDKSSLSFKKLSFNSSLARSWNMLRLHQKKVQKNSKPKVNRKKYSSNDTLKSTHAFNGSSSMETEFKPPMLYPCWHCSCQFSSEKGRNTHCQLIHSNSKYISSREVEPRQENIMARADKIEIQNVAKSHVPTKEKLVCVNCGYAATCKSQLNMHMQKSHVKNSPFTCKLCSCAYTSQEELIRHELIHHYSRPHQ